MQNFELAALYEFSGQESFVSYEQLFDDLVAKLSRIFAARRIVMEVAQRRIYSWGFGRHKPALDATLESPYPVYERELGRQGELGRIWLEKATPFLDCERRLLTIYLRQVEKSFYAIRHGEELASANDRFLKVVENAPFVVIHGYDRDGRVLYWNKAAEDFYGFAKDEVLGRKIPEDLPEPKLRQLYRQTLDSVGETHDSPHLLESLVTDRNGERHTTLSYILTVGEEPRTREFIRMDVDISERKRIEEQLRFNSLHDRLTGLFNRRYFDQEMDRLDRSGQMPMAILVCDLDGLKLINDTLGHQAGDTMLVSAANILKSLFRREDVIARIGGDEFAILMKKASHQSMMKVIERIRGSIEKHNLSKSDVPISISIGYAIKTRPETRPADLFKEADNHMYREKMHGSRNNRDAVVQALTRALEERDFFADGHVERLEIQLVAMAEKLNLARQSIDALRLLARFHDIGKVGIKEHILEKPGPLTFEERQAMEQHCEIGYRIAQASPNLAPIADWILKHHEWWNGCGYPLGLQGDAIPLECRILSIADAYDAMTSDRPYRQAMSPERALAELKKCAGTQFDATLVGLFKELTPRPESSPRPGPLRVHRAAGRD